MANNKIIIDILANVGGFVKDVLPIERSLQSLSSSASRTVSGISRLRDEFRSYSATVSSATAASKSFFHSFDEATLASTAAAVDRLSAATRRVFPRGRFYVPGLSEFGSAMGDVLDPGKVLTATGYRVAYGIADMPIRAIQNAKQTIQREIQSTAQLEGSLYDLEAYLGGPGGEVFVQYAKDMGYTGDATAKALQDIQNKILSVGQTTTFTSSEIAEALTTAAKAGVTLKELGAPGEAGALDAIALFAQNTGESLDKTAEITAKIQEMFRTNLNKSQIAFGQATDEAAQYMMVVNSLSQADASSAASASQLAEALFNVGGSANNINMSFFDTVSLVSAMVPAFESAASAGTSLKYVFSRMTGANSVKAQESMKAYGLMDEEGQSVFFDEKGFKGLAFMVKKLREVFSDEAGMPVDLRNKIITEIFGQDALKAVSRMISMDDQQVKEMIDMADKMQQGAREGVDYAAQTAEIKNEGLEFDIEYLQGSLDSLSKTLTMPLMKPFSNVVQSMSGLANGMFAILTGASRNSKQVQEAYDQLVKDSIVPNAKGLFDQAMRYAESLKFGLDAIVKEGFTTKTLAIALASVLGTSKNLMDVRVAEFQLFFQDMYDAIALFIKNLPSMLSWIRENVGKMFDFLIDSFNWIKNNWDGVVFGLKAVLAIMVADSVIQATNNWVEFGRALADVYKTVGGLRGAGAILEVLRAPRGAASAADFADDFVDDAIAFSAPGMAPAGGAKLASKAASPGAAAAGKAATMGAAKNLNTWTSVGLGIQTAFTAARSAISSFGTSIGAVMGRFTSFITSGRLLYQLVMGLRAVLVGLTSPLAVLTIAIVGMTAAWVFNVGKIQEWTKSRFGTMYEYISQTWEIIKNSFSIASVALMSTWNDLTNWFSTEGGYNLLIGFSNMFKGVVQILESLLLIVGGSLKMIVGLLTGNGDLIKAGFQDIAQSFFTLLGGLLNILVSAVQAAVNIVAGIFNWVSEKVGLGEIIPQDKINNFFNGVSKNLEWNGVKAGMNFSKGVQKGLKNSASGVNQSSGNLGSEVKKGFNYSLDIRSPSGEGIIGGENFGDGVVIGLNNSRGVVNAAASSLATNLSDSFIQGLEPLKNAQNITTMIDERIIPVIFDKPKLSSSTIEKTEKEFLTPTKSTTSLTPTVTPGYVDYTATPVKDVASGFKYITIATNEAAKSINEMKGSVASYNVYQALGLRSRVRSEISLQLDKQLPILIDQQNRQVAGVDYSVLDEIIDYRIYQDKREAKLYGRIDYDVASFVNESKKQEFLNKETSKQLETVLTTNQLLILDANKAAEIASQEAGKPVYNMPAYGPIVAASKGVYKPGGLYDNPYYHEIMRSRQGLNLQYSQARTETKIVYREKTPEELASMQGPAYIPLTQVPVGAMRGDFANLPLDQYSTPEYDVSKNVKQFLMTTGQNAIEQRGLSSLFENEQVAEQFKNIGNRAATYLSLRQGQLKPNEVVVFQQLLAQDRADKMAYLKAVGDAQQQIASGGDPGAIISQLISSQQGQTQSFKDIFNVNIKSLSQYTSDMAGSFDEYAKLGPQAFNEALAETLNPANQSAAFKALTPEAQASLVKSVQDLPSQAMAFLGDAMSDGTLDSTEFDTYMMYVGEDISRMREIIMRGTPPTQEEIDAVWNPFIDGTAKVVNSADVTGVLGNALVGASKILFQGMGKEAWQSFLEGWYTNDKGEKVQISALSISELLGFTPENIKESGVPVGQYITGGILKGIQDGLITGDEKITEIFDENGDLVKVIREKLDANSPSEVIAKTIGVDVGLGIADGIVYPEVKMAIGSKVQELLNTQSTEQHMILINDSSKMFGFHIGTNMMLGLSEMLNSDSPQSKGLGVTLLESFDILLASYGNVIFDKYKSLGHKMAQGVATGFSEAEGLIVEALAKAVKDDAIESATLMLKIKSPSRLYADKIGSPMAEGIAMGISNSASSVGDALSPLISSSSYSPDISGVALGGAMRRSQMAAVSSSVQNNYNLSLATTYPGQTVQQQFEIMRAFKGRG